MYILLCCRGRYVNEYGRKKNARRGKRNRGRIIKIKAVDSELVKLEIKEADVVLIGLGEIFISAVEFLANS